MDEFGPIDDQNPDVALNEDEVEELLAAPSPEDGFIVVKNKKPNKVKSKPKVNPNIQPNDCPKWTMEVN